LHVNVDGGHLRANPVAGSLFLIVVLAWE